MGGGKERGGEEGEGGGRRGYGPGAQAGGGGGRETRGGGGSKEGGTEAKGARRWRQGLARHRGVAHQGEDDRQVSGLGLHGEGDRGTPARPAAAQARRGRGERLHA